MTPSLDLQQAIQEQAYFLWERAGRPAGQCLEFWLEAERQHQDDIDFVREASEESFPCSDPPSRTAVTGVGPHVNRKKMERPSETLCGSCPSEQVELPA